MQIVNINTAAAPTLTSAAYDEFSTTLVVTGSNLVAKAGGLNDIDISKLTVTEEGGSSYTLTSTNVEIDSATQFTLILNAADSLQIAGLLNKNGSTSGGGTTYNIAAASGWNPGANSSPDDATGNAITVANVASPTPSPTPEPEPTPIPTLDPTPADTAPLAIDVQLSDDEGDGLKEVITASDGELIDGNGYSIADAEQSDVVGLRMINNGAKNTDYGALETDTDLSFNAISLLSPTEPATDTTGIGNAETYAVTTRDCRTQTTSIPTGIDNAFAGLLAFTVS